MRLTIVTLVDAILGAFLGAVLGYELFGFFLARAVCPLDPMFNGWSYAFVDILPGDKPALARLAMGEWIAVLIGGWMGAALVIAILAGQRDHLRPSAVPSKIADGDG